MNFGDLEIETEAQISDELRRFRTDVFPSVYAQAEHDDVENTIDGYSMHITLRIGSELVGYSRITDGRFHVFSYFTDNEAELPQTSNTWSLGRGGISAPWRNAELLTLVVVEGIIQSRLRAAQFVVGAVPPKKSALTTICRSMMVPIGAVVLSGHPGQRTPHQPVIHASANYKDKEVLNLKEMAIRRSIKILNSRTCKY
jgi:hypothetical protein